MKDALVCSLSAVNPIRPLILWRQSSLSYFVLCQSSYVVPSPLIMALSSRTITVSINYRCAPFSATLMHRGRRAALKTPSDACAEDCRGKLIWPRCPINACSPWCVPIITLRESVLTTKPRQRFSAVTCCTSNVNPPASFHRHDCKDNAHFLIELLRHASNQQPRSCSLVCAQSLLFSLSLLAIRSVKSFLETLLNGESRKSSMISRRSGSLCLAISCSARKATRSGNASERPWRRIRHAHMRSPRTGSGIGTQATF